MPVLRQPLFNDLFPSPRCVTYTALADDDAIKTSIATVAAPATYSGGALNGAYGGTFPLPQTVSVTTSSSVGSYILGAIVFTGTDQDGSVITESLTLTAVNGNETIKGTTAFATITSIVVPAQFDTSGTFKFGVFHLLLKSPMRKIRASAAGNLVLGFQDGNTDTLPCTAGEQQSVLALKVLGTTSIGFTVYL